MKFVAVDVETANPDLASICQIGVVVFEAGRVSEAWDSLIDPEDYFDPGNVAVHGITEQAVVGAPTIRQIHLRLCDLLVGQIVAHHSAFDRAAINKATKKYGFLDIPCDWLDTARVARRAWPAFATRGYGLANLAATFGIEFRHHNAHEDARAAGEVLIRAVTDSGFTVADWLKRAGQAIKVSANASVKLDPTRQGNPDGVLAGEVVVFTGALSISRKEAADLAAEVGCDVTSGVNKQTSLLVVGDQDVRRLVGHEKSTKHRKADELRAKGQQIRILGESDFLQLVELARRHP